MSLLLARCEHNAYRYSHILDSKNQQLEPPECRMVDADLAKLKKANRKLATFSQQERLATSLHESSHGSAQV